MEKEKEMDYYKIDLIEQLEIIKKATNTIEQIMNLNK